MGSASTTSRDFYLSGATTTFALQADQRFSYCMYVPQRREGQRTFPLAVIVHGTGRTAQTYRDLMAEFCEEHGVVALCPLFPSGIIDPEDIHNFKFIDYQGIRYDHLLFQVVEEASLRVPIETERFMLHGFSGGGQFTQRMLFMYPERLSAASIGASGRYTLLDHSTDWWLGVRNTEELFGVSVDPRKIAQVPIQLLVGELDTDTWETMDRSGSNWVDGLERQGATRIERMEYFKRNLAENGVDSRMEVMPGIAHEGAKAIPYVTPFFAEVL